MGKLGKAPAGQRLQSSARDAALAEPGEKKTLPFIAKLGLLGA